ncbi:MAG: ATP-binding protein [Planctomycetes bacterium]|nr:ATP-binding protein [Planctomycetota bacterium]
MVRRKRCDTLVRELLLSPDPLSDEVCRQLLGVRRESRVLDFKQSFDPNENGDWCEVIKDLVAMANTDGGYVMMGANDDGSSSLMSLTITDTVDQAVLVDKMGKYTEVQPSEVNLRRFDHEGAERVIFHVGKADVPIVFCRPGTYPVSPKKQKTAFSAGAIYFRHGSKSEPARQSDIQQAFDKFFAGRRRELLAGVRKVVSAPAGHQIAVLPKGMRATDDPNAFAVRVTDDPSAPAVRGIVEHGEYQSTNEELAGVIRDLATDPEAYAAEAQLRRFYRQRTKVSSTHDALRAMLVCSMYRHCPAYYWALHLGRTGAAEVCQNEVQKDRYPAINVTVRIAFALGGKRGKTILERIKARSQYRSAVTLSDRLLPLVGTESRVWHEYGSTFISIHDQTGRQSHRLDSDRVRSIEPLLDLALKDKRNRDAVKRLDALVYGSLLERTRS